MTAEELLHLRAIVDSAALIVEALPVAILRESVAAYEAQHDSEIAGLRERGG